MFKSLRPGPGGIWEILYSDGTKDRLIDGDVSIEKIINCFKIRNLNIAANLILHFKYDEDCCGLTIESSIEKYYFDSNEFRKYHDDVMKWLMLV
jgi:hypothetical protein